jgi:hypothetical protein
VVKSARHGGQALVDASTQQIPRRRDSYVSEGTFVDPTLAVVADHSMAVVGVRQDPT